MIAGLVAVAVALAASWAAGTGLRLSLIAQSYAQLKRRWGAEGAAVTWQCCKTKVIFGGTSEDELCALAERACGTVRVRTTERDHGGGRRGHEDMPLLPAAALRMLPAGRAVVIQGRAAPVIVRVEQVRHRADYKRQPSRGVPAVRPATASPQIPAAMPGLLHDRPAGTLPGAPDDLTPAVTAGPES